MAKDKKPKTKTGVKPKLVKVIVKDGDTKPSDKSPLTIIVLALIASVSLPAYFLSESFKEPVKQFISPPITQTYEVPKTPAITVQPTIVEVPEIKLEELKTIIEPEKVIEEVKPVLAEIKSQEVFGPTVEEFKYGVEVGKESPLLLEEYLKPVVKKKKKVKVQNIKEPAKVIERPEPIARPEPVKVVRPKVLKKKKVSLRELIENNDSLREKCAQQFDGTTATRIERNLLNCPVSD